MADYLSSLLDPYRRAQEGQEMSHADPLYSLILSTPPPTPAHAHPPQASFPGGSLQTLVQRMAEKKYGWTGGEWDALSSLIEAESGWNPNAENPNSSAAGLFQFLDSTRDNYGVSLDSPLKQQIKAGLAYISDRYGSPSTAWSGWSGANLNGPPGY